VRSDHGLDPAAALQRAKSALRRAQLAHLSAADAHERAAMVYDSFGQHEKAGREVEMAMENLAGAWADRRREFRQPLR
jgi:Tfp pilus assembly protein PilF